MNPWSDEVAGSAANVKAGELKRLTATIAAEKITNDDQDYIDRVNVVADEVISKLSASDPRLVNRSALVNLGNALTSAATHLSTWIDGNDEAALRTTVQSELDAALTYLPTLAPTQDVAEARESITSLRRAVARHRTVVDKVIADLEARGSSADETIDEKVAAAKTEFTRLDTELTALDAELAGLKDSTSQVATQQQTAFTKAEADRSKAFNDLVGAKQKELEAALATLDTDAQTAVGSIREKVAADEKQISDTKERVEKILGIVGEEALTGDYAKNARQERKAADLWRWIAAGSIVVAIGTAIHFAASIQDTTTWQHALAKVVVVASFGGLAGYAARQSSEHRTAQRHAERMALQLTAIKPYLNDIDDSKQRDELLTKIADRLFGQEPLSGDSLKPADNPLLTAQLIEALLELIKKGKP